MARTMLKEAQLPTEFWGEAVATAVYILNRSPTTALKGRTPHEVLTGSKPNVEHLRVFGCSVHSFVNQQQRRKFDATSTPGKFIGYCDNAKAFKVFDRLTKRVQVNRNVHFFEKKRWDWSNHAVSSATNFVPSIHVEEDEADIPSKVSPPHDLSDERLI